jgi:hypothetical protein
MEHICMHNAVVKWVHVHAWMEVRRPFPSNHTPISHQESTRQCKKGLFFFKTCIACFSLRRGGARKGRGSVLIIWLVLCVCFWLIFNLNFRSLSSPSGNIFAIHKLPDLVFLSTNYFKTFVHGHWFRIRIKFVWLNVFLFSFFVNELTDCCSNGWKKMQ